MRTALIQAPLIWEDPQANRDYFSKKINEVNEADLIILPEMFSTGFTMQPQSVAEKMSGDTVLWMQATAIAKKVALTGSIVIKENDRYYNRLLFVYPSGTIQYYDKRHLFTLAGEDAAYTAGNEKIIIEYNGWRICPFICYDLRFPVFSRNDVGYDLLIYVANWPRPRVNAWDTLLKARAIENMSYVVGVNRIGVDENGYEYTGHSQVIDGLGNWVLEPQETERILIVDLDKAHLSEIRQKFSFLDDRDQFKVLVD